MVLHPLTPEAVERTSKTNFHPAWDAVAKAQRLPATSWWLVTQPDHAALAGDLAAAVRCSAFPSLDPSVIQAIALHDAGWAAFDVIAPGSNPGGRPLSFLDMAVAEFLSAWTASIERAEVVAPIGGFLVSEHFCRLAATRLSMNMDGPGERENIHQFLRCESTRKERLAAEDGHSLSQRAVLVDVLQFCDLLSLYLCCGSRQAVEFPQHFHGESIRLWREGEEYRSRPQLFGAGVSLGITARRYPASGDSAVTIPFLVA